MFFRRAGAVLVLSALLGSCGRESQAGRPALAILRFDNLSGDPARDWVGRALAEALSMELAQSQRYQALPVSVTIPPQATAVAYGRFSGAGNALRVELAVHDLATHRRTLTASASDPSLLAPVTALARQLDPAVRGTGLPREDALRSYAQGIESPDPQKAASWLEQAIQTDPGFGRAYVAAIELAKLRGDRAAVERYLAAAEAHAKEMQPTERAVLARERAATKGDVAGQIKALAELAQAQPSDPGRWRTLAQAENAAGNYADAIAHFRRALELDSRDVQAMNELGYALAYAGRLEEATEVLRRYEKERPAEGNPLDSLGDAHFYSKRFREAAGFYEEALKREPSFQNGSAAMKAALAWLLAGDSARAEQAFARFRGRLSDGPEQRLWQAQWLAIQGKEEEALRQLSESHPLERAQVVILALDAGDRDRALRSAPGAPPIFAVLATPDWQNRIASVPEPARSGLTGYGSMFSGRPAEAAQAFERARKAATASDRASYGVLAAWCLRKAGSAPGSNLLQFAPILQMSQINPLAPVYYRRLSELLLAAR